MQGKSLRNSIRRISLVLFLSALILCAGLALISIWGQGLGEGLLGQFAILPSLFIVGLTSFLIWLVVIIQDIYEQYIKETE